MFPRTCVHTPVWVASCRHRCGSRAEIWNAAAWREYLAVQEEVLILRRDHPNVLTRALRSPPLFHDITSRWRSGETQARIEQNATVGTKRRRDMVDTSQAIARFVAPANEKRHVPAPRRSASTCWLPRLSTRRSSWMARWAWVVTRKEQQALRI